MILLILLAFVDWVFEDMKPTVSSLDTPYVVVLHADPPPSLGLTYTTEWNVVKDGNTYILPDTAIVDNGIYYFIRVSYHYNANNEVIACSRTRASQFEIKDGLLK